MKRFYLLAAFAIAVSSCGNKTEKTDGISIQDTTKHACDTSAVKHTEDAVKTQVGVKEKAEVIVKKGIYKAIRQDMVKTGPSVDSRNMKSFFDGQVNQRLSPGQWLEATGEVKNGYAKVREHLIEDECEGLWEHEYGWVPAGCLRPAKCNHQHLMAEGKI